MGNIDSTQPFTDAVAYVTHPLLAQRIQELTIPEFNTVAIVTPAARIRYVTILLEQGRLGAPSIRDIVETCKRAIIDKSASLDYVEGVFQYIPSQGEPKKNVEDRNATDKLVVIAHFRGSLLDGEDATKVEGLAWRNAAVEAEKELLDRELAETEVKRRDAESEMERR